MNLIDNINVLKRLNPNLWKKLREVSEKLEQDQRFKIIEAKSGVPTLEVEYQGKHLPLHSRYNPEKEAEKFINQFDQTEVTKYKHVFFYGVGMGYHITAFMNKYPNINFSLYEPNPTVFYKFLSYRSLKDFPIKNLKHIFVEQEPNDVQKFASEFLDTINEEILFVILPSYERVFKEDYKRFVKDFLQTLKDKRSSLHTNLGYQKRWIINSLINFPEVLKTPNILHDIDKENFMNKPALLVAAGPSLDDEIENIRYIKGNNLAYIFSIGSAINALIEHNIYPNAICSYDPSERNQVVFTKMIDKNITSIPLIFGSSIGFESLQKYPGKDKFHMITSQDTVSNYFLKRKDNNKIKVVLDAPSIAVLTLDVLYKLGCNPIILVGQNLGYRKDKFYAKGISYKHQSTEITEEQKRNLIEVEDVYGGRIYSDESFLRMKKQMEYYIEFYNNVEIINTTKGGAKIEGTSFMELANVIKNKLKHKVNFDCFNIITENTYDIKYVQGKIEEMEKQLKAIIKIINDLTRCLQKIYKLAEENKFQKLEDIFKKLDKLFSKMNKNDFYKVFLQPMNRVQYEILKKNVSTVRFEKDMAWKARKVVQEFGKFIQVCQKDIQFVNPIFKRVSVQVLDYINESL
ncbi:MAG: hypothetical protein PWP31_316 [Clostridia bacterium]|nr:hypothetical protein [Clostridia bacterium]